jgi:hypothetical protein
MCFTPGDIKKQKKVRGLLNITVGGEGSTAFVSPLKNDLVLHTRRLGNKGATFASE